MADVNTCAVTSERDTSPAAVMKDLNYIQTGETVWVSFHDAFPDRHPSAEATWETGDETGRNRMHVARREEGKGIFFSSIPACYIFLPLQSPNNQPPRHYKKKTPKRPQWGRERGIRPVFANKNKQTCFLTDELVLLRAVFIICLLTAKDEVSKRVRVRLTQVSPCNSKDIKDQLLTKLQKKLLSQEVCNFPCKIYKPNLRCRTGKRGDNKLVVSVNFDIEMKQNVISTSKFCNNTCARCQIEERLQQLVSELRLLTDNSKLNVTLSGQTFTLTKRSLRVNKESDHCYKERTRRKIKRQGVFKQNKSHNV